MQWPLQLHNLSEPVTPLPERSACDPEKLVTASGQARLLVEPQPNIEARSSSLPSTALACGLAYAAGLVFTITPQSSARWLSR